MDRNYNNLIKSVYHLKILDQLFNKKESYLSQEDYELYKQNSIKLTELFSNAEVELFKQLYNEGSRQMILADLIEYIFLSRGLFFILDGTNKEDKKNMRKGLLIKALMRFVNLLMVYESMTVDQKMRKMFLDELGKTIPEIKSEEHYKDLNEFRGSVGLKRGQSDAAKANKEYLDQYFDKILPKTAGGLWHELLVFTFLLRKNHGYIIPLLLQQKCLSGSSVLTPPDFLIVTKNKDLYGIEVGTKKEIQSGSFSLITNIPTATIDTENSRCSDRCPICKRWILFCDKVIEEYSDMNKDLDKIEIKCLEDCKIFGKEEILSGKCPYTKYSRAQTAKINHKFSDGLHYHYRCVLNNLTEEERKKLIEQKDNTAIKTHYPYYAGLEML